ncbi:cytochrome P450 family protein [Amycolatopsis nigrescens]|uniref:cytochrome P450 family protein n=1 Tax=Amycolatopsis nigrescens TaxID=381445 RepID=UPI001FE18212|nr:cytochrome P450 [Amycolatopsis nigrescens]
MISRYDDARRALTDPRLSKDRGPLRRILQRQRAEVGHSTDLTAMFGRSMMWADGEEHVRLRRPVARAFTPRRVTQLRPWVEQATTTLLDQLPTGHAEVDLVDAVAFPLPVIVICELLGVPSETRSEFRAWTRALMAGVPEISDPASHAMEQFFRRLIADKRDAPAEDVISALVTDTEDPLSDEEIFAAVFLLFVAGHETTTNLLGNAVRWLLEHPDHWRDLAANPDLATAAVEAVACDDAPVRTASHRFTTEPVTYGGVTIPAGEIVMISLTSANRDEAKYSGEGHLDRDTRGHLAFGYGPHFCLGAALARMEAEVVLRQLTTRFPDARLAVAPVALRRLHGMMTNGHLAMPVRLRG